MSVKIRNLTGQLNISKEDYLRTSLQIYDWVSANRVKADKGVHYIVNPGGVLDYSLHPVHGQYGLYSGSAGIGYYLLRLYEVTGNEEYLEETRLIVEELIENVAGKEFYLDKLAHAMDSELKVVGWHTGIYSGPSGAGALALELYKKVADDRYLTFAKRLADDILEVSELTSDGLTLTGDLDIFSDGSFVLYFISVYELSQDAKYLDAAREYARFIRSKAVKGDNGGEFYYANELSNVGMPKNSIYPGFAHGSAGIGFLFAVLYELDKEEWELEAAKEVGTFISTISDVVGEGRLVPYIYGGENSEDYIGKYYLGFCHGPAGTSLLYRKLYAITGDETYKEKVLELARGIIHMGAPEYNSWGLWNSYCLCCGTPGLIEFFTDLYEFTNDPLYLEYAKKSAAKTIADSSAVDGGRAFFGHWDRTNHRDVQTYTGLYVGASGAGANLLRLYAHLAGKKLTPIWEYSYV